MKKLPLFFFLLFSSFACERAERYNSIIIKGEKNQSQQKVDSDEVVYMIADTMLGHNHIKIERHLNHIRIWRNHESVKCFFIPYDTCEGEGWYPLVEIDKNSNLHYLSIISLDSTRFVFAFPNGTCRGVSEIFQVAILSDGKIKLTDSVSIPHWGLVDVKKQRLLYRSHLPYFIRFIKQKTIIHEKMYIPITIISLFPKNMFALIKQYEIHENDSLFNDLCDNNPEKALIKLHKKHMN